MAQRQRLRVVVHGLMPGRQRLDQEASHYLTRVHRVGLGGTFLAIDPAVGSEAQGVIEQLEGDCVVCTLAPATVRLSAEAAEVAVELWVGMLKGDKLDGVINAACQIGVSRLVLVATSRAVVRARAERLEGKRSRWERILGQAVRQSGRAKSPELVGPVAWSAVLERRGPASTQSLDLVFDPGAERALPELLAGVRPRAIRLLIGPEGGFSAEELNQCLEAGFQASRLGPHTLRSETAALVAAGITMACLCAARGSVTG